MTADANTGIAARKSAEGEVGNLHEQLERRVKERTAELSAANSALIEEIAERKQTELELLKARRAAERSTRDLRRFEARHGEAGS